VHIAVNMLLLIYYSWTLFIPLSSYSSVIYTGGE